MADVTRRGFLGAILAAAAAPAIAKAESLMRVKPIVLPGEAEFVDIATTLGEYRERPLVDGCIGYVDGVRFVRSDMLPDCGEGIPMKTWADQRRFNALARQRVKALQSSQLRELKRLTGATSERQYCGDGPVVFVHSSMLDDLLKVTGRG